MILVVILLHPVFIDTLRIAILHVATLTVTGSILRTLH